VVRVEILEGRDGPPYWVFSVRDTDGLQRALGR
jgi:hypothetical protein